jgi:uncharacterized membrane protein (UPF0127 family)
MSALLTCDTPMGAVQVRVADRFLTRALGLLVGPPLGPDQGLLIAPCSSIHTLGMRYPIDVVFLDRDGGVLKVCADVRAGRARFALGAHAVLELRAGSAARQGIVPGVRFAGLATAMASA